MWFASKKTIAKRGVTRLPKIHKAKSNGNRIEVQWNARGQPVKHNSKSFASFIGVTIRRLVPISLDNWSAKRNKAAVDVYKENIWDEIQVKIEVSIVPNALLPISVEYGDVSMVGQAIGTIVPWPLKLLQFVGECEKIPNQFQNKDKNIQRSVESVSSPNKSNKKFKIQESPKVGGSTGLANLPFLEMYTKKMMRAGSSIQINMEESIFGEEFLERLRVDNTKEIIDHNWLRASIITVFARYLFDKFISPNGLITKFSFISPHVSQDDNQGNTIAKILLKDKEFKDRMILAPCNIGKHWVLLVINPDAEMIYYMDPLNGEPTKYQNLKTKFDNTLQIYRAHTNSKVSKSKKIAWPKIKCPRQINVIECGYFVMRYMKEVIMENENMIPVNYFPDHKSRTYSKDKLSEVKEDFPDHKCFRKPRSCYSS